MNDKININQKCLKPSNTSIILNRPINDIEARVEANR